MRNRMFVCFVAALFVLSPFAIATPGTEGPYAVFLIWEDREYEVGDTVDLMVHVFKRAEFHDPTHVFCEISDLFEPVRTLDMKRVATGKYATQFRISRSDIGMLGYVWLHTIISDEVADGGSAEEYNAVKVALDDPGPPRKRFAVDVIVPDQDDIHPEPGQRITYEAHFTFGEDYVEPDPGTLDSYFRDTEGTRRPNHLDRQSTGLYTGSYVIPPSLAVNSYYRFYVRAEYSNETRTWWEYDSFTVYIDFYEVWANYVNITSEWADLELYVTDAENLPVNDANVHFEYSYYNTLLEHVEKEATARTDAEGKSHLVLDYLDLSESDEDIFIHGYVTGGDYRQEFSEWLYVQDVDAIWPYPWLAIELLDDWAVEPGGDTEVDMRLLYNGSVVGLEEAYIYVMGWSTMYSRQALWTDGEGILTVEFTAPHLDAGEDSRTIVIYVQTMVEGHWDVAYVTLLVTDENFTNELAEYLDPLTTLTVEPFQIGGQVNVTLDHPLADGVAEMSGVQWWISDSDGNPIEGPQTWASWSESFDMWGRRTYPCTWNGEAYETTFNFPQFMPENSTVTFFGIVIYNSTEGDDIRGAILKGIVPDPPDPRPALSVKHPMPDEACHDVDEINGTAWAKGSVQWVELRLDDGEWTRAKGTNRWSHAIDTTTMSSSSHMLLVRCFDGRRYSDIGQVFFRVNQVPEVEIVSPADYITCCQAVAFNGTASDDAGVERVEYRLDGGEWQMANGAGLWSFDVDTSALSSGDHIVEVRSADLDWHSEVVVRHLTVDHPPSITIVDHHEGKKVHGRLKFAGTTADDNGVTRVEASLDGGEWFVISGTDQWTHNVSAGQLSVGAHTLEVRSFDGRSYSEEARTTFVVERVKDDNPGFPLLFVLLALALAWGRRRSWDRRP